MQLLKYMTTCYYAFISNKTFGLFTCSFLKLNNLLIFHRKILDFLGSCQLIGQLPIVPGRICGKITAWGSVLCHGYIKVFKVVEDEL